MSSPPAATVSVSEAWARSSADFPTPNLFTRCRISTRRESEYPATPLLSTLYRIFDLGLWELCRGDCLIATMSDYDDDMDVDAPASKNAVQFSSDNTSGKYKRAAADLPVEAQDNLPW